MRNARTSLCVLLEWHRCNFFLLKNYIYTIAGEHQEMF